MAYRDPYSSNFASGSSSRYDNHNQPYYGEPAQQQQYPTSQQDYRYHDNMGEETYDPYSNNAQAPYRDEGHVGDQLDYSYGDNQNLKGGYDYPPIQSRGQSVRSTGSRSRRSQPSVSVVPVRKEGSGFELGEFTPTGPKSRTPRALREYRYDHQGNLWTKGGRGRCAGRVCCCTLMSAVFLIVSILLALALWIRPPSVMIGNVQSMEQNGSVLQQDTDGFQVNLGVNISVNNPNYFSVALKKIQLEITYPINNTPIGGGSTNDIVFKSSSQTNFTFPFDLKYSPSADSGGAVFVDLSSKCGATPQNVIINYKIRLGIRILIVTISPTISNQFNFLCPVDITKLGSLVSGG